MMISRDEVIPLLLEACPSFRPIWEKEVKDGINLEDDGTRLYYVGAGDFAHHLVSLVKAGQLEEFAAVLAVFERLHLEGDDYVKELATIGYLEGLERRGTCGLDRRSLRAFPAPRIASLVEGLERILGGQDDRRCPADRRIDR